MMKFNVGTIMWPLALADSWTCPSCRRSCPPLV